MKVVRDFIDLSSGQVHLRRIGKQEARPALLCLHMMPKSSRGFVELMPELAKKTLVIAPDYPGCGESDAFPFEHPSIADYAKNIAELIAAMNLGQVDLLGYHTGSMISVELATHYPELVNRIVCIGSPVLSDEEIEQYKAYFAPIPLDLAGTRFSTMWSRVVEFSGPGMSLEMGAVSMAENLRGGERYEDGHQAAFNYAGEFVQRLSELEHPLLALNIGDDVFEKSKAIAEHINNGEYQEAPHWGHGCLELWPRQVASVLLEFYRRED